MTFTPAWYDWGCLVILLLIGRLVAKQVIKALDGKL
jgi:hypothetical protein